MSPVFFFFKVFPYILIEVKLSLRVLFSFEEFLGFADALGADTPRPLEDPL